MRQTNLSREEHSVTDKIEEAARVSPATDAALAACSEKVGRTNAFVWSFHQDHGKEQTCHDPWTGL